MYVRMTPIVLRRIERFVEPTAAPIATITPRGSAER